MDALPVRSPASKSPEQVIQPRAWLCSKRFGQKLVVKLVEAPFSNEAKFYQPGLQA
jgi:hypothetical protein